MDVIEVWTGRGACTLQAALRMTNERFAAHLGVAIRTVAQWHAAPAIIPRTEIQQALDTAYERASEPARRRFELLAANSPSQAPPSGAAAGAQALRVAVAIVTRRADVLLVCRRGDDAAGIRWQFPAGVVKPGVAPESVAVRETHAETGVHCAVRQQLGNRVHPATGVLCDYFLCDYLAGEAINGDVLENIDVTWAPRADLTRFIPFAALYPPIVTALEVRA